MRKPRVYIASGLENAMAAELVRDDFLAAGWEITHDWTQHGSVQAEGEERIREIALAEIQGVVSADVVVVLLPGGRGTHAEMGIAIGSRRPVLVVGDTWENGRQCAFYFAPDVWQLELDEKADSRVVPAVAAALLPKGLRGVAGMR